MRGGYEKCNRFFNTGYCSFDKGRGPAQGDLCS